MNLKKAFFALNCALLFNTIILGAPKPTDPIVAPQPIAALYQLPITIIIYDDNTELFKSACLDAALKQDYASYTVIYLCDQTAPAHAQLQSYLMSHINGNKVTVITCDQSQGKLKALYNAVHSCPDNSIIIPLDAHDWFAQPWALTAIATPYIERNAWLTYGSCIPENKNVTIGIRTAQLPAEIKEQKTFRDIYTYTTPHSFYAWLFKLINEEDLIDPQTGNFYLHATQCHVIWPLIEMAADHFEHIKLPLLSLNCQDPIRMLEEDHYLRVACNEQLDKTLPVYQALSEPQYRKKQSKKSKDRKEKRALAQALTTQFQLNAPVSSPTISAYPDELVEEVHEQTIECRELPVDEQQPITILMYAHNASSSIVKSLDSVLHQQYEHYRILVLDDASSDDTNILVKNYISALPDPNRIQLITSSQPQGKLQLLWMHITACGDNEIILLVDAQDRLAHERALETIAIAYTDRAIWLTYGTAIGDPATWNMGPCTGPIPQAIVATQQYRKIYPCIPPCTFYAGLFKKIQVPDLMDPSTHTFFEHAAECHIMWPLMELAHNHMQHIQDVLYVTNYSDVLNALSQEHYMRVACNNQMHCTLPVYHPLTTPVF